MWKIENTGPKNDVKKDGDTKKEDKPRIKKERSKYEPVLLTTSRRSTTTVKSEMSRIKRKHEEDTKPKRKGNLIRHSSRMDLKVDFDFLKKMSNYDLTFKLTNISKVQRRSGLCRLKKKS